jgi:hypothetical protein
MAPTWSVEDLSDQAGGVERDRTMTEQAHPSPSRPGLAIAGLSLIAIIGLVPLVLSHRAGQLTWVAHYHEGWQEWLAKAIVLSIMAASLLVRVWADQLIDHRAGRTMALLAIVAAAMTSYHWITVDTAVKRAPYPRSQSGYVEARLSDWQRALYLDVLNGRKEQAIPHVFRPLPYGFVRSLELITGDWWFSCLAYRWFFTTWFLWASFDLVRLLASPHAARLAVAVLFLLYPLSVRYYGGQLTDPLSHVLFVLALSYLVENRLLLLAGTLILGILTKETAVIIVPAYLAYHWREGWKSLWATVGLAGASVAGFLAPRLGVGWRLDFGSINGAGLMIKSNLGMSDGIRLHADMILPNYLPLLLFLGVFLPFIAWHWRSTDSELRALFLVLVPLLFASNLCFGWLYESRNYMPAIPLLVALAMGAHAPADPTLAAREC